jgi:hypothetical protein
MFFPSGRRRIGKLDKLEKKSSYPRLVRSSPSEGAKRVSSEVVTHCNSWIPVFTEMTAHRTFQLFAKASNLKKVFDSFGDTVGCGELVHQG